MESGKNILSPKHHIIPLSIFISQFPTSINLVLFSAAVFSFLIHDLFDGVLILSIIFLNSLFGFIQEYQAEKSLEKLKSFITPLSRVFRGGKEKQIPSEDLIPGDRVILSEGDRIPADGILRTSYHMEVDESILTGESLPVIKKQNNTIFASTLVTKGKGHLLIQTTGLSTRFGQIAQTLSEVTEEKTPLQKRLDVLGKTLSLTAICIAFLLIPIEHFQGKPFFSSVFLAISIAIAAIPEGLPAVLTIALGIGTNRMAKKHAIVRKMIAVETLGSIGVLLFDKTGTLTQNKMIVKKHWVRNKESLPALLRAALFGNTASLVQKEPNSFDLIGDKTDASLLVFAKNHIDIESVKKEGTILDEYVFDPNTQTIATIIGIDHKQIAYVRGAPEKILEKSTLTEEEKKKITNLFKKYAKEGLRVIAFGSKVETHKKKEREHIERNLTFLGFVGIYDPPRPEMKESIADAKRAGVIPVMITGDNELTALSIAKEVGMIEKDEDVITSDQLEKISDEKLIKILPKIRVFARAKPHDKLRLTALYQKLGFVVGVTGDGVNDTLALKKANVGIAMGESGTDVAKEASDIVLTDDNFSTLVKAIEEGRIIYNNIVKSVVYLLSGNLAEISLVLFSSLAHLPSPLLPTQILWINVVTDGLPALALASDTSLGGLLKEKPRNPKESILTRKNILFILFVGFSLSISLLILYTLLLTYGTETKARTITFNLLIFFHLLIAFFVRGKAFLRPNRFLVYSVILTILIQIIITTVPVFQTIFHLGF